MALADQDFVEFVETTSPSLRRTAYLICGDRHKADDIVHDLHGKLGGLPAAQRYAVWWLFYRWLSTGPHAAEFAKFIDWANSAPMRRGYRTVNGRFCDTFDLDALDRDFKAYVLALGPNDLQMPSAASTSN